MGMGFMLKVVVVTITAAVTNLENLRMVVVRETVSVHLYM